jgi:hypothetical protein
MPTYGSKDDRITYMSILEWKQTAIDQVDDIRGWRQAPIRRALDEGWPDPPDNFFSQTSYLCGWLRQHHPGIDPAPLEKIYRAVTLWHTDENAKRIASQSELEAMLDLAIMRLQSVERAIEARFVETPAERGTAESHLLTKPVEKNAQAATWQAVRDSLLAMKARGKTYTNERRLAGNLHCSPGTVHKAIQKTPELRTWSHGKGKTTVRAQSLTVPVANRQPGRADDPADAAAANETQARLIQEQARDMRAEGGYNKVCGRRA